MQRLFFILDKKKFKNIHFFIDQTEKSLYIKCVELRKRLNPTKQNLKQLKKMESIMTTENIANSQNTNSAKCTTFEEVTFETLVKDTPNWERLTKSLESYITDLGNKKINDLFSDDKVKNQPLAILLHTSAGAVGDKFANAKTKDERFKILLKLLRGKLTEEEEKREKELIKQKAVIDTLRPIWGFLPESEKMKYSEIIRSELGK